MKEPEQRFSPESIDQLTEHFSGKLPAQDSRLIADLYQAYAPYAEEYSRSLQRIWSRFAQVQEGQKRSGSAHLSTKGIKNVNIHAGLPDAPVHGSFQLPPQPLPRRSRRSLWSWLSGVIAAVVALLIVLSLVLLTHAFLKGNSQTVLGASLTLDGGPHLEQNIVFWVKSSEGGQYLETISFDMYDGHTWSNGPTTSSSLKQGNIAYDSSTDLRVVQQQITVVNPPGEQFPYLFGASQIAASDQAAQVVRRKADGSTVAWLRTNGKLAAGNQYNVTSYVSNADVTTLETVLLPKDAPSFVPNPNRPDQVPPLNYYDPNILHDYLQVPANLDPNIQLLARQITSGSKTMYEMALALENYLHSHYRYTTNIALPPGQEGVSWFLFRSGNQGFCNYFATAMAIMARELGIPARVVIGYTSGSFDAKTQNWVVRGSDAHAWTQIYFAGYGWINFEPSASFQQFTRPLMTNGIN